MDILELARENLLISFCVVLAVGLLQGMILGRGIRRKLPGLKTHARLASIFFLVLFMANTIVNVVKFAIPDKLLPSELSAPATIQEGIDLLTGILGLDAGFLTALAMFVSIILVLTFRFAEIPRVARYFIFGLSVITFSVFLIAKLTPYVPTAFQVVLYALYQFGITIGVFAVMRRKDPEISRL